MVTAENGDGDGGSHVPRMRVVPLRGPITERSVYYFVNRLLYLAAESPKEPILMEVTSPGGLIPQSLEIIRIMDRLTCTVNTLSRGVVSGTSVVIAAHGARGFRTAMANCRFSLTLDAAEISNPEQAEGQALVQKVVDLLVRDGSKGKEQILSWLRTGEGFSAQQALEVGLIDFISTPSPKAALAPAPRHR